MSILDSLIATLPRDIPLRSVLIGAHWTVVCSRHCGMAATKESDRVGDQTTDRWRQRSALELAEMAYSPDLQQASLGVAAINSLLEVDESLALQVNASEVLAERGRGKRVAIVGHSPFVAQLRAAVGQLWVIEQHPVEDDYPAEAAADLIPRADVVAITGSALVNHTLDGLLALCRPDAMVMLLGPSTPLSPLLFDHGVDILSGARVIDEAAVLRTVAQGASFRQVEGVRLLTLTSPKKEEK